MGTTAVMEKETDFGRGNCKIVDTPELVTFSFDPRRVITKSATGNPMVCTLGGFTTLLESGVRIMLHVKAPKGTTTVPEDEIGKK